MSSQVSSRRNLVLYSGLLGLSFIATYGYLAMQGRAPFPALGRMGSDAALPDAAGANAAGSGAGSQPSASDIASIPGMGGEGTQAPDPIQAEQTQARDMATEAGRDVISGTTPDARREAMIKLNAMASRLSSRPEPDLLQSLGSAASSAPEWQIRLSAVTALAGAARQMQDPSPIIPILERATGDPQNAVARRAAAALQELKRN